jgi:hypothetical protein
MAVHKLKRLYYSVELGGKIVINGEWIRIWNEEVVVAHSRYCHDNSLKRLRKTMIRTAYLLVTRVSQMKTVKLR